MATCSECGFEAVSNGGLAAHVRLAHPGVTAAPAPAAVAVAEGPRSERGRRRASRDMQMLSPLEQIRARPSATTGPWSYWLRLDGGTIRDALVLYPNGAQLPPTEDARGKYSLNHEYYQARQRAKGYEYVGPILTAPGVKRLIEVLQANKEDEILDLEDQIAECDSDIKNSDRPDWRDNQRKRKAKLQRRLDHVRAPLDAEALTAELNDIARAQRMARVSSETLMVMREMLGEQDQKFQRALERFQSTGSAADGERFEGVATIEN
jgi:hypothetical protein